MRLGAVPNGAALFSFKEIRVKIEFVQIELSTKCQIEMDTDGYVYGVETAQPIFYQMIGKSNVEQAGLLCLDHSNKVINYSTIAIGTSENVNVSVGQIFRTALLSNADKIIIAHNHPSGVLEITSDDLKLTQRIGKAASLFNISLIDSLIINAAGDILSIREKVGDK